MPDGETGCGPVPDSDYGQDDGPEDGPEDEPEGDEPEDTPDARPRLQVLFDSADNDTPGGLSEPFIRRCCLETLRAQLLLDLTDVDNLELSIQLLAPAAMRELNLQYRQKDSPTNVLSFAAGLPVMIAPGEAGADGPGESLLVLGDLVLCPRVVDGEASAQARPLLDHWAHMLVHGTLHLCGYDHEEAQAAQAMEAMEIQILSGLGIPDPYSVTANE